MSQHTQVSRTALMKLLDSHAERAVVYIHAPAGFGKTVSALLWLEHRGKIKTLRHSWVSLDGHDNKTADFCKRFVTALASFQADN